MAVPFQATDPRDLSPAGLAPCLQASLATAQGLLEVQTTETVAEQGQEQPLPLEQRAQINYDATSLVSVMGSRSNYSIYLS